MKKCYNFMCIYNDHSRREDNFCNCYKDIKLCVERVEDETPIFNENNT